MPRFKYSLLAAVGLLLLVSVISLIGPKRALAALGYTPVRDVDGPARQPFSIQFDFEASATTGTTVDTKGFNVPSNKRLVITYVSANSHGGEFLDIQSNVNGQFTFIDVPFTASSPLLPDFLVASQQVMGFADPGTLVQVQTGMAPNGSAHVDVYGYLVDVP